MKILIVGNDLNALLLANYIKLQNNDADIYMTSDERSSEEIYTSIDIKENDIASIVDFVKYNAIEFTIASSKLAIINGIADEFKKEGFLIFAPFSESSRITYFNSVIKKILYKLKINTPKFGIFDRENLAIDYVRNTNFPIIIKNDFTLIANESHKFTGFRSAKLGIQKLFEENNEKIIIENCIDLPYIYVYFITDGYNAFPLISLERAQKETDYEITAPSSKIAEDTYISILKNIVYPLIDDIAKFSDIYTGILGFKIQIQETKIYVTEIYNKFESYDSQAFLSLLDDNILDILYATAKGELEKKYGYINLSEKYSYTKVINKSQINNLDLPDDMFIESEDKENYIITSTAATLNQAKENLNEYLEEFKIETK